MHDFIMAIPCSTECKKKISSFLFKTKLLLNGVFRTNNDHKVCFTAVYLMIYCIAVCWGGKKRLTDFYRCLRFFTPVLLLLDSGQLSDARSLPLLIALFL